MPRIPLAGLCLLAACAGDPAWEVVEAPAAAVVAGPEADAPLARTGIWRAGGRTATLDGDVLLLDGEVLARGLVAGPAAGGPVLAWSTGDGLAIGVGGSARALVAGVRAD